MHQVLIETWKECFKKHLVKPLLVRRNTATGLTGLNVQKSVDNKRVVRPLTDTTPENVTDMLGTYAMTVGE